MAAVIWNLFLSFLVMSSPSPGWYLAIAALSGVFNVQGPRESGVDSKGLSAQEKPKPKFRPQRQPSTSRAEEDDERDSLDRLYHLNK